MGVLLRMEGGSSPHPPLWSPHFPPFRAWHAKSSLCHQGQYCYSLRTSPGASKKGPQREGKASPTGMASLGEEGEQTGEQEKECSDRGAAAEAGC